MGGILCGHVSAACLITKPQLNTNPNFDVVLTRTTPVLSFKNAAGGQGKRAYEIQVARDKDFTIDLAAFSVQENPEGVTALSIPTDKALADKTRWYWRVRAVDETGAQGPWATSRFSVDVASDKAFMGLTRAVPVSVKVSSGSDPKNLTDYSDQGLATQWRATPPGSDTAWVDLEGKQGGIEGVVGHVAPCFGGKLDAVIPCRGVGQIGIGIRQPGQKRGKAGHSGKVGHGGFLF